MSLPATAPQREIRCSTSRATRLSAKPCFGLLAGLGLAILAAAASDLHAADDDTALRYRWQKGQSYIYEVKIEAEIGDSVKTLQGTITYTVEASSDDEIKVRFTSGLNPTERFLDESIRFRRPPGYRGRFTRPPRPYFSYSRREDKFTTDSRGVVIRLTGESHMPYLLGRSLLLVIETLPEGNETAWEDKTKVMIEGQRIQTEWPGMRAEKTELFTAAIEKIGYKIVKTASDSVEIHKTYELTTLAKIRKKPEVHIEGEGTLVFDTKLGLPRSLKFEQIASLRVKNILLEIPTKISYTLLDEAALAKRKADGAALAIKAKKAVKEMRAKAEEAKRKAAAPLTSEQRKEILAGLRSDELSPRLQVFSLLTRKTTPKPEHEISQALAAMLKSDNASTRSQAARLLLNWGTQKSIPEMVKALQFAENFEKHPLMNALGKLKAKQAIEPIAKELESVSGRHAATQALEKMGPIAEAAVLKRLTHKDLQVRVQVCNILSKIGTKKSLAALEKTASSSDAYPASLAKRALQNIRRRES